MRKIKKRKLLLFILLVAALIVLTIPQQFTNPVEGADRNSYNSKSFWFYPWGRSGVHKGVDIFAKDIDTC